VICTYVHAAKSSSVIVRIFPCVESGSVSSAWAKVTFHPGMRLGACRLHSAHDPSFPTPGVA
jgi:hypothetical protein